MRFIAALLLAFAAHAAPPVPAWSPTDHSQFAVISGTATRLDSPFGGSWSPVRSDTSQSTGVRYVEFTVNEIGPTGVVLGLANGAAPINNFPGVDSNGIGYYKNGNVMRGSAWVGVAPLPPAFTTGDVIGMSVDFGTHKAKFNKNGGSWSGEIDIASLGTDIYIAAAVGVGSPLSSVSLNAAGNWNDYLYPTDNVVVAGDSITLMGAVSRPYFPRLLELIKANRVGYAQGAKFGINGVTWQYAWSAAGYSYSLIQDAPIRVDPARHPYLPNWLVAFAGTNGFAIFHDTPARQCADAQTYIAARIAAGWQADHIVVPTMLPRTGVSESDRSLYNACLVANASVLGYKVARLDLDPNFGVAGANLDPSKYPDGTHPAPDGQQAIAQIIFSTMFP